MAVKVSIYKRLWNIEIILVYLLVFSQFIDWLFSLTEAPEESLSQVARGETVELVVATFSNLVAVVRPPWFT